MNGRWRKTSVAYRKLRSGSFKLLRAPRSKCYRSRFRKFRSEKCDLDIADFGLLDFDDILANHRSYFARSRCHASGLHRGSAPVS